MKGHQRPLHIVLVCEAAGGGVGKHARAPLLPATMRRPYGFAEHALALRSDANLARDRVTARAALGLPDAEVVIGFVGGVVPQKAPELALEAFGLSPALARQRALRPRGRRPQAPEGARALAAHGVASDTTWMCRGGPDDLLAARTVSRARAHHFEIERMIDRLATL